MTYRLEIAGLTCARGDRPLFSGLDVDVGPGELLHVTGGNGSGKTTLLRTISGLSRPAAGEIRWRGHSLPALGDEYRREIVYVGHLDGVQGELTPAENLYALACSADAHEPASGRRISDAIARLGLDGLGALPAKVLSQGQRRRLALARLLLAQRPLWILDEPFTALDARSCALMNEILASHLAGGGIAVVSSHQRLEITARVTRRLDLDGHRPGAPSETARAAADSRLPAGLA